MFKFGDYDMVVTMWVFKRVSNLEHAMKLVWQWQWFLRSIKTIGHIMLMFANNSEINEFININSDKQLLIRTCILQYNLWKSNLKLSFTAKSLWISGSS